MGEIDNGLNMKFELKADKDLKNAFKDILNSNKKKQKILFSLMVRVQYSLLTLQHLL